MLDVGLVIFVLRLDFGCWLCCVLFDFEVLAFVCDRFGLWMRLDLWFGIDDLYLVLFWLFDLDLGCCAFVLCGLVAWI